MTTVAVACSLLGTATAAPLTISDAFSNLNVAATIAKVHSGIDSVTAAKNVSLYSSTQIGNNITMTASNPILLSETIQNAGGNTLHVNKGSVVSQAAPSGVALNFNSGGTLTTGTSALSTSLMSTTGFSSFESLMTAFNGYSVYLKDLPGSTVSLSDPNSFTFNGDGSQFPVFNISGSDLVNAHGIQVNLNGGTTAVVNVFSANDMTVHANRLGGEVDVIWNFIDTNPTFVSGKKVDNTITFTGSNWNGGTLNPDGTLYFQNGATGLAVADTVENNSQMKNNPITGPPMAVPETGSSSLLALSLGALMLRRKR